MIFEIKRDLTDKVFTSTMKFKDYGGIDLDSEEEQVLIDDFGSPIIDLGAIDFVGKFDKEDGAIKITEAEETGDEVSFVLNSKKVKVDKTFLVNYSIDAKKIDKKEIAEDTLNTAELIAEAKCLLFEEKVKEAVKLKIDALKLKGTSFERSAPIEFTV